MPAPALAAALPLVEPTLKAASSVALHVLDALRTPLIQSRVTTSRSTKRGTKETTTGFAVPAWAAIAAAWLLLPHVLPPTPSGGGGGTPLRDPLSQYGGWAGDILVRLGF